jgi:hypothetical protein
VSRILENILTQIDGNKPPSWPSDDGCHDYWEMITENLQHKRAPIAVRWMPSHLDEEAKRAAKEKFIASGGPAEWTIGNCGADEMAKKGAALAAPPGHLMSREKMTCMLAKAVQRMAVHVWAAEKGLVTEDAADGHEAEFDDHMFLDNTLEEWGNEEADPYLSAFNDLLDATLPEQGETISENGVDDPDPWNGTASSAPQGSACTTDHAQEAKCSSSQKNGGSRSLKRLDKCKNDIQRIAAFYPLDQSAEEFITTTDTSKYLNDVDVYNAMRAKATKKGKVKINLEWIEPILWSLNEFRWSCECKDSDETAQKRSRSCTFVELTCAIDILTGGICGRTQRTSGRKPKSQRRYGVWRTTVSSLRTKCAPSMNSPR